MSAVERRRLAEAILQDSAEAHAQAELDRLRERAAARLLGIDLDEVGEAVHQSLVLASMRPAASPSVSSGIEIGLPG